MLQKRLSLNEKLIVILLVLLSIAATFTKILVGFDIDEGYAISMPFRLIQGDHLFLTMWEVHQTSSFLPALFIWPFVKITGATTGIAVYLRVITTVIHFGMSLLVWNSVRKDIDRKWALLIFLVYYNFLPKWMMTLDFSMQQIWGLTLVFILFKKELLTGKRRYDFWMGVILALTVLAYPGMVICYPMLLLSICLLYKREQIKTRFNKCAMVTLGCVLMAILFFVYLLFYMDISQLLANIPKVFMDGTHQFTIQTKLLLYVKQWINVGKQLFIFGVPSILITIVIYKTVYSKMLATVNKKDHASQGKTSKSDFIVLFTAVSTCLTSLLVIIANVFGIQMGPFHFQVRYLLFYSLTWILIIYNRRDKKELLWSNYFITTVSFIGILIFSNVGPDSSSSYLVTGVIAGIYLLDAITKTDKSNVNRLLWYVCAVFILSLIFCKGYYVRITEYGPSNILQHREQVTEGPLTGIYLLPEDYERVMDDHRTVGKATAGEDRMLFLGTEGILNLSAHCKFVSPSTISTPAFNEQWVDYFEMHPDIQPSVIILAKNTIDDRDKFFAKNPFGMWISSNYDILHMEETSSLCIIRK